MEADDSHLKYWWVIWWGQAETFMLEGPFSKEEAYLEAAREDTFRGEAYPYIRGSVTDDPNDVLDAFKIELMGGMGG